MLSSQTDVVVRSAKVTDAARLTEVFRDSWSNAYTGLIPHKSLQQILTRRDAAWWRSQVRGGDPLIVLEAGGIVGGYATAGAARSRSAFQGEIYELYLAPQYQGLGFGEYLFEACRYRLDHRQLKGMLVWALSENERAISFYANRGGRPVAKRRERFGSTTLEKVALAWR